MNRLALTALMMAGLALAGCQSSLSGDTYSRDQARREMSVRMGTVEAVRAVTIEGTKSHVGTASGAAIGGLAGGRGSTAGAIAGAVVGGVAGALIEEGATRRSGQEITIRLDNGNVIAVVQEGDEKFNPGDRVKLVGSSGNTRVSRY